MMSYQFQKFAKYIFLLLLIAQFCGCSDVYKKVDKHLKEGRYDDALILLEKENAGKTLLENASEKAIKARDLYRVTVTNNFTEKCINAITKGNAREALNLAYKGYEYCPWSEKLTDNKKKYDELVSKIDKSVSELQGLYQRDPNSHEFARYTLKAISPHRYLINDTPLLIDFQNKAQNIIVNYIAEHIKVHGLNINNIDSDSIISDITLAFDDTSLKNEFHKLMSTFRKLPKGKHVSVNTIISHTENIRYLIGFINGSNLSVNYHESLKPIILEINNVFINYCMVDFLSLLNRDGIPFKFISFAEELLSSLPALNCKKYKANLANAHIQIASKRMNQGKVASLALVHLSRAINLDETISTDKMEKIKNTCNYSIENDLPVKISILIDGNQYIDPTVYDIIKTFLALEIISRTKAHIKWEWVSSIEQNPTVLIYLKDGKFIITSDLQIISSEYLSHYEDVPNPQIKTLEYQMAAQDINVSLAKSNYNSAVNSHNYYPTQYSLNNVNLAYSRYKMSVDNYNNLVNLYNMTPATMSRAVYLLYTFHQGVKKLGWSAEVEIKIHENQFSYITDSIDSDLVRIGTKFSDKKPEYRRDDQLSFDYSIENAFKHLSNVIDNICDDLSGHIVYIDYETRADLSESEKALLNCILYPFVTKIEQLKNINDLNWCIKIADKVQLPEYETLPHKIVLEKPKIKDFTDKPIKEFAKYYESMICEIRSSIGNGSGVLISPDGKILTCAHVLYGANQKAIFHKGRQSKEYNLEIIYANDKKDVAIVKAHDFVATEWAPVCFDDKVSKGESIIAIGNPAIQGGNVSLGSISKGIISNPSIELSANLQRMLCDITIAQGSSGCPIFSQDTGEVIGIVVSIIEGGIRPESEVSSSGCYCVAAPTYKLGEWLQISY